MVHRSPFFTQSVAVIRSRRSFLRGDDQVADARHVAVGQLDVPARCGAGEAVIAGPVVEAADQLTGWRQPDRVQALAAVGLPGVENARRGWWGGADVDESPVELEAERFGSGVADGEGGGGLGRVGEAMQLGQPDRAVAGLDVTEDAAGADGSEDSSATKPCSCQGPFPRTVAARVKLVGNSCPRRWRGPQVGRAPWMPPATWTWFAGYTRSS